MKTNRLLIKIALSSVIAASAFIFTPGVVMAQVKVGSNPSTIGTNSNLEIESTNGTKVIVDKTSGQLGAGVTDPTQSIDVSGTARLRSIPTNTVNNLILTVDANGVIAKQNASAAQLPVITGVIGAGVDIPQSTSGYLNTGSTITLPANSKYVVNVTMLFSGEPFALPTGNSLFLRSSFFNSATETVASTDIIGSKLISGLLPADAVYGLVIGSVIIQNSSSSAKTYYFKAGQTTQRGTSAGTFDIKKFGGSIWGENQIYAVPIN